MSLPLLAFDFLLNPFNLKGLLWARKVYVDV